MKTKIIKILPYVVMCVLLTGIAIWAKMNEAEKTRQLIAALEKEMPVLAPISGEAIIIDVRAPEEYKLGHIKNAYNIPHDRIRHEMAFIAPDREPPILLYCRSGKRAELAKETLAEMGYMRTLNLNTQYEKKLNREKDTKAGN